MERLFPEKKNPGRDNAQLNAVTGVHPENLQEPN
jgi:hypothetical protein